MYSLRPCTTIRLDCVWKGPGLTRATFPNRIGYSILRQDTGFPGFTAAAHNILLLLCGATVQQTMGSGDVGKQWVAKDSESGKAPQDLRLTRNVRHSFPFICFKKKSNIIANNVSKTIPGCNKCH